MNTFHPDKLCLRPEVRETPGSNKIWQLPEVLRIIVADGGGSLVIELLELFKTDTATRLQEVDRALILKDLSLVRNQMHALKGSARQIGAEGLAAICEQIEAAGLRALESEVPQQLRELKILREGVLRAMEAYAE